MNNSTIKTAQLNMALEALSEKNVTKYFNLYYDRIKIVVADIYDECEGFHYTNGTSFQEGDFCDLMCTSFEGNFYKDYAIIDASYELGGRAVGEIAEMIWDNMEQLNIEKNNEKLAFKTAVLGL